MKSKTSSARKILSGLLMMAMLFLLGVLPHAAQQSKQPAAPAAQKAFDTPDQAAQALIQAAESYDVAALLEILGADGQDLVASQDPVADRKRATDFAALAREKTSVTTGVKSPTRAEVSVGLDEWPLPIPIVKRSGKWYYDTKSGRQEVLLRRIGEDELDAIQICRGFVEAQREYALEKHDDANVHQYAQRIISTPGKQDGLAWQNPDGSWGGPVGEQVARALQQGYTVNNPPYHGYYFKVLKGQGPAAQLGQMDFVVNGVMIGGFALAAAPAQYRVTGVKTFIVSHDGIVYEKDLGPNSTAALQNLDRFNPDKSWRRTEDEW